MDRAVKVRNGELANGRYGAREQRIETKRQTNREWTRMYETNFTTETQRAQSFSKIVFWSHSVFSVSLW
jgi:hypothetical protein